MTNSGIPLSEWSGSGATHEFHETIKKQIEATNRQSKVIGKLAWATFFLALVEVAVTVIQFLSTAQP